MQNTQIAIEQDTPTLNDPARIQKPQGTHLREYRKHVPGAASAWVAFAPKGTNRHDRRAAAARERRAH